MNRMKTYLLLAALTSLLLLAGQAMGGRSGLMLALAFAVVMNVGSYWFSDTIVLRMHSAQEIGPADSPKSTAWSNAWSKRPASPCRASTSFPMTRPTPSPPAAAPPRVPRHDEGILRTLSMDELEGVIAHELAHIAHRDTLIMTVSPLSPARSVPSATWPCGAPMGGGRSHDDDEGGHPAAMLSAPSSPPSPPC